MGAMSRSPASNASTSRKAVRAGLPDVSRQAVYDVLGALTAAGLVLSGVFKEADLVEVVEIPDHPWFLGCQFHPEFKSKPLNPHPLFKAFVGAALGTKAGAGK